MAAHQVPLPMGFSRQEYWSGLLLPSLKPCCYLSVNKFLLEYQYHFVYPFDDRLNSCDRDGMAEKLEIVSTIGPLQKSFLTPDVGNELEAPIT